MNNHTTISTHELDALRHWAAIGQSAVELAAEALKLDNQEIDHETVVASLVFSEAVMVAEVDRLVAERDAMIEALIAIEACKHWIPAVGDRVRMISGTGHTRRLVACATIAEIVNQPDSHPYHLQVDGESMPLLWATRDAMVKA